MRKDLTDSSEVLCEFEVFDGEELIRTLTRSSERFGVGVRLSGDGQTLAVGAPLECSTANEINGDQTDSSAYGTGAVYLY